MKVDHKETDYRFTLSAESTRDLVSALTFCIQELPPQDRRHKLGEKLIRQIRLTQ
jgi:hypothetical protein